MICRNRLDHIKRSAERKHYLNLFNEQKSNLQKSWHILKMVIDKRKCTPAYIEFQSNGAIPPTNKDPSEYWSFICCVICGWKRNRKDNWEFEKAHMAGTS